MNFRQKFFKIMNMFGKIVRLGQVCMSFIRLDDDKTVYNVPQSLQAQFKQFKFVVEREAVVNPQANHRLNNFS